VARLLPLASLLLTSCQQEMAAQPAPRPDEPGANRPLVRGTVARGHLRTDAHLFTGTRSGEGGDLGRNWAAGAALLGLAGAGPLAAATTAAARESDYVDTFPFPVTRAVLQHGQDRFLIYCVVCHDPLGNGRGKIVERGYTPPPSFHIERLRKAPVGHFFDVITNGYGSMPDYRQQVPVRDRWAIVAYVRALQLSQHYPERDLSADMRAEWDRQRQALGAGGAGE
jgi:mono/diheme cytochrome c family protein